jgi:hypothetical protein
VLAVLCLVNQLHIYLLSLHHSSLAKQVVAEEEEFIFIIQTAKAFCILFVDMIAAQVVRGVNIYIRMYTIPLYLRIMLIIHRLHVV